MNEDTPVVVVDVETTGFSVERDRVYEIGMVTRDPTGQVIERFETLIRPTDHELRKRLTPHLAQAPTFGEVAGQIISRLRIGAIGGHATLFDLSMLDAELARLGSGLPEVPYLCTNVLAAALHVDSPNRQLGMLCHVLGVEMPTWHTALGDAEASSNLLARLLSIAEDRGLLAHLGQPHLYPGQASDWPSFPSGGRVLVRDPVAFPPIGDQPHRVDPVAAAAPLSVEMPLVVSEELAEKVRRATQILESRRPAGEVERADHADAWEDWEAGQFRGENGVQRLRRIFDAFIEGGDDEAWQVGLQLAQLMRYEPTDSDEATARAYSDAMDATKGVDREDRDDARSEVLGEWVDFLTMRQDVDGLAALIQWAASDEALREVLAPSGLVHRMRTSGQLNAVLRSAQILSGTLGAAGLREEAANVCAEWAQALADDGKAGEAVAVCEQSWSSGWSSRALANRHSLLLERAGDWRAAIEVCDRGLALAPVDDQIGRRRMRCLKRLS